LLGAVLLAVVVGSALSVSWWLDHDPEEVQLTQRLLPPSWPWAREAAGDGGAGGAHWLGTDSLGRDVWARLLYGARVSLLVGVAAVVVSGVLGISLGLAAGFLGGPVDTVIMRLADIQLAFPLILLAVTLMAVVGPGLLNVVIVLGVARWVDYARVVRAEVLSLKRREFVEAARAQGARGWRIIWRHLLPNMVGPITVIASFAVASNIIYEASLSYLGLGVGTSVPTWGGMLSEGQTYLTKAWWLTAFPGMAILLTVLSVNLVGDWLRDVLDPQARRG